MFRLSLLILLCQISAYSGIPQRSPSKIEVTVMDQYSDLYNHEVQDLFDDYGKRRGISSSHMHVQRIKNCIGPYKSPARFEAYVTSCNDFQMYLLYSEKWLSSNYNLKMIHVKCDQFHFSHCLIHSCQPKDYIDLATCAYNYNITV